MLKKWRHVFFVPVTLALLASVGSAQVKEGIREEVTVRGKVESIDHAARTVTLRGDKGNMVTVDVPPSATRFDQVKVGNVVTVSYYDRVVIRPKPAGEAPVDKTTPPTTTPTSGSRPGGTLATQRTATVTITGWDPANRVVSFKGPNGASYTRGLLDTVDPSIVAGLKIGERYDVTWTVATRVAVQ